MPELFSTQSDIIHAVFSSSTRGDDKQTKTIENINKVLQRYFLQTKLDINQIDLIDSFLYIFNVHEFSEWKFIDWWKQRAIVKNLKNDKRYQERAMQALHSSWYSKHFTVSDFQVGASNDPAIKYAWMRKRLFLEEGFWNIIDSVSFAAYHENKYEDMFAGFGAALLNLENTKKSNDETILLIDNGAGKNFKKYSKDSGALRFFHTIWKLAFKKGLYQLGGLRLGLQETYGALYCFGDGAVTTQYPYDKFVMDLCR